LTHKRNTSGLTHRYKAGSKLAVESAKKSQESWIKNGKKPRGGFRDPELARQAGLKGLETVRKNRLERKKLQD